MNTSVDINTILQILLSLAAAAVAASAPLITAFIFQRLGVQKNSAAAQVVDMAVQRAGGLAYAFLSKEATGSPHSIDMQNAAVAVGLTHVAAAIPAALTTLGITPEAVSRMVTGELGKLMAADPGVTIGPVAAPVAPPDTAPTVTQGATP